MRYVAWVLFGALVSLAGGCEEPDRDFASPALAEYCLRLRDPRLADPLEGALEAARRAHEDESNRALHCVEVERTLDRTVAFLEGFSSATSVAARSTGQPIAQISPTEVMTNTMEARGLCRNGDFNGLNALLRRLRTDIREQVARTGRACEAQ